MVLKQPKRFAWIASELADRGYQQKDLAKAWGIDDAVVTRFIATGKPDLTPERMMALSRMLVMDYNELMVRMYENIGGRRRSAEREAPPSPSPKESGAHRLPGPATVESIIAEINRNVVQLRKMLPGARINFSIDYGEPQ